MFETFVALTVFSTAVMVAWLGPETLLTLGSMVAGVALVASTVAGVVYHVRLHTVLRQMGPVPDWWWWSPSRWHSRLEDGARDEVFPWFRAGAAAFGVCGLGLLFAVAAVFKAYLAAR